MKILLTVVAFCAWFTVVHSTFAQAWIPTSTPVTNWWSVAAAADGSKLVGATSSGCQIYISTNGGADWLPTGAPQKG